MHESSIKPTKEPPSPNLDRNDNKSKKQTTATSNLIGRGGELIGSRPCSLRSAAAVAVDGAVVDEEGKVTGNLEGRCRRRDDMISFSARRVKRDPGQ